jgi:hypothetical protein
MTSSSSKEVKVKTLNDLAEYNPAKIAADEQFLFRYDIWESKGWFKGNRSVLAHLVSNYRVGTFNLQQVFTYITLESISDVLVMDSRRESEGAHQGFITGSRGFRYYSGRSKGRSVEYGDVVITSPDTDDQTWYNIKAPDDLVKLIKSLRKTRLEQLDR